MAFKPNYNFQKNERNRAKALKKQEKLRRKQAARGDDAAADPETDAAADPETNAEAGTEATADAAAPADKAPGDA